MRAIQRQRDTFAYREAFAPQDNSFLAKIAKAVANDDIGIDDLHKVFSDYVRKGQPINPETGRPHTPESAIRDWPSGVVPFIQATRPDLPFERYKYEPHTRGLDEYQDAPSLIEKLVALHTREKYGTETMYRRQREFEQQARTLAQDLEGQTARGMGVRSDGTFGPMPVFMGNGDRPDGSFGPKYIYPMPDGTQLWHFPDRPFEPGQAPPPPPANPQGLQPNSPVQTDRATPVIGDHPFQTTPR